MPSSLESLRLWYESRAGRVVTVEEAEEMRRTVISLALLLEKWAGESSDAEKEKARVLARF